MFDNAHSVMYETHVAELTTGKGDLRTKICFLEIFYPTQLETDASIILLHEQFPESRVSMERVKSPHNNFVGRSNHDLQGFGLKLKVFEPRCSLHLLT